MLNPNVSMFYVKLYTQNGDKWGLVTFRRDFTLIIDAHSEHISVILESRYDDFHEIL